MICGSCGATAPAGSKFCPECGSALAAAPDQRRLVTVLMTDIVGFTSMSEDADPERVKNVVDGCFERLVEDVRAFGGALDKIVGDELVATFGAQQAHEDDAERAVRAALQMCETTATYGREHGVDISLRTGINTGEVLVGAMRAGGDPTVMGDVVNTASRLEKSAEPGTIVVGAATHAATHAAISYEALGLLPVRGRAEPVEAWRAVESSTPPGRRLRLSTANPIVGRDDELATLRSTLDNTVDRSRSNLVLLFGEAGVGKTRLLVELGIEAARERGLRVMGGNCLAYGESHPLAPLADMVRLHVGIGQDAEFEKALDRARSCVASVLQLPVDDAETTRVADALLDVLGYTVHTAVDPVRSREETARGVLTFLEAVTRSKPIVIGLSDLQWAHDDLLALIDRSLERMRSLPFMVVGTARPELTERWQPSVGRYSALSLVLEPLGREATAELARNILGAEPSPDIVDVLHERSGGNPLFVEELLAVLASEEHSDDPDAVAARLRQMPATLRGLVAARLDALTHEEKGLLQDFAVVGTDGAVDAALSLSDRRPDDPLFETLANGDLLSVTDGSYRFKSELIREIAYSTLTKAERARRHAALRPWLEAHGPGALDVLAQHLSEAAALARELGRVDGLPDDIAEQAQRAVRRAGEHAEDAENWRSARRHWDDLLGLLGGASADRTADELGQRALLGRARAEVGMHDLDRATVDASDVLAAAEAAGDRRTEAAALLVLGEAAERRADYDDAEQQLLRAVALARAESDDQQVAAGLRRLGSVNMFRGDTAEAERLAREALEVFRHIGDRRGEAWGLQNLAWIAFTQGRTHEAGERLERSAELFTEIGDWGGLSWALGLLAFVRYAQGDLTEARELAEQIAVDAERSANKWAMAMMRVLLADVALWTGRAADCLEEATVARGVFAGLDDSWGQLQAIAPMARAANKLARFTLSDRLVGDLHALTSRIADPNMSAVPANVHSTILNDRGDGATALASLPKGLSWTDEQGRLGAPEFVAGQGFALLQTGAVDLALDGLEASFDQFNTDGPRANVGGCLALAYACAGRPHDATTVLEAIDGTGTWADRLVHLYATGFACLLHGDADDANDARTVLEEAVALADGTDSVLDQAIARLALCQMLDAAQADDAASMRADTERRLAEIGIAATGWRTCFALAAGGTTS